MIKRTCWLAVTVLAFFACGKRSDVVPYTPVSFQISLSDPRYSRLNIAGNAVIIQGNYGVAGVIVYHDFYAGYLAYDRCSSYQPEKVCAVVIDTSGFTVTDPCSGSKFSLSDGSPVKAPATRSLKSYNVNTSNNQIFVFN